MGMKDWYARMREKLRKAAPAANPVSELHDLYSNDLKTAQSTR